MSLLESLYNSYTQIGSIINEYLTAGAYGDKLKRSGASETDIRKAKWRRGVRVANIRNYVITKDPKAARAAQDMATKIGFGKKPKKGYDMLGMASQAEADANSLNARAIKKALKNPPAKF